MRAKVRCRDTVPNFGQIDHGRKFVRSLLRPICYIAAVERAQSFRRQIGLWLTPGLFLLVWIVPLDLEPRAHRLAAIFAAAAIAWVTEVVPISVTALMIGPLMVACGVTDAKSAFAPYADPLIFLFVGGFFIAQAMMLHGLDRRLAVKITSSRLFGTSAARVRLSMMAAGFVLSMWISNTASAAIVIPILLGTVAVNARSDSGGGTLAIAYACSAGGMATLIGTPPNALTARFLNESGHSIDFGEWLGLGLPIGLAVFVLIAIVMHKLAPPEPVAEQDDTNLGAWTRGQRVTALSFGLAVLGWTVPSLLKVLGLPIGVTLTQALPSGVVAMLAASVLFVFRTDGKPVLPWREAEKIDWGLIYLFGGGLALGAQMVDTGLAATMSRWFINATGVDSLWGFTAALAIFTVLFTEVCSNTASANMLVPFAIAGAHELGVSVMPPTLAVAFAASCAYMLPIATGPNAIAYGTGAVQLPKMMRYGTALNLGAVLVVLLLLRALSGIYGW